MVSFVFGTQHPKIRTTFWSFQNLRIELSIIFIKKGQMGPISVPLIEANDFFPLCVCVCVCVCVLSLIVSFGCGGGVAVCGDF